MIEILMEQDTKKAAELFASVPLPFTETCWAMTASDGKDTLGFVACREQGEKVWIEFCAAQQDFQDRLTDGLLRAAVNMAFSRGKERVLCRQEAEVPARLLTGCGFAQGNGRYELMEGWFQTACGKA